jgi:hypothetical protein
MEITYLLRWEGNADMGVRYLLGEEGNTDREVRYLRKVILARKLSTC